MHSDPSGFLDTQVGLQYGLKNGTIPILCGVHIVANGREGPAPILWKGILVTLGAPMETIECDHRTGIAENRSGLGYCSPTALHSPPPCARLGFKDSLLHESQHNTCCPWCNICLFTSIQLPTEHGAPQSQTRMCCWVLPRHGEDLHKTRL